MARTKTKPTPAEIAAQKQAIADDNLNLFVEAKRIASIVFGGDVDIESVLGTCELLANPALQADAMLAENAIREARALARKIGFPSASPADVMAVCDVLVGSDSLEDAEKKMVAASRLAKEIFSDPDLDDVVAVHLADGGIDRIRAFAERAGLPFKGQGVVAAVDVITSEPGAEEQLLRAASEIKKLWGGGATLEEVVALYHVMYSTDEE